MIFTNVRLERAIKELEESGLKEKEFIVHCLRRYCPLIAYGAPEPSLGQVLASAHAAWQRAAEARGEEDWQEPFPVPGGEDDV